MGQFCNKLVTYCRLPPPVYKHPKDTLKGLKTYVKHPLETFKTLKIETVEEVKAHPVKAAGTALGVLSEIILPMAISETLPLTFFASKASRMVNDAAWLASINAVVHLNGLPGKMACSKVPVGPNGQLRVKCHRVFPEAPKALEADGAPSDTPATGPITSDGASEPAQA
jgi:hypothetical protein